MSLEYSAKICGQNGSIYYKPTERGTILKSADVVPRWSKNQKLPQVEN